MVINILVNTDFLLTRYNGAGCNHVPTSKDYVTGYFGESISIANDFTNNNDWEFTDYAF